MGLDIHYQVIPDDCRLLARSRQEPKFGSHLEFFKRAALMSPQDLNRNDDWQFFIEFASEIRQLIQQHPGIEYRNLNIDRTWDKFHYLLSYQRRNGGEKSDRDVWVEKAILGGEVLDPAIQTTIGIPICYLSPIAVYEIQDNLDTVELDLLGVHWNPVAMRQANVYKIGGNENDEDFYYLQELFTQFKAFYASVSEQEGVLTFMT
jgi:Domain of unknown function (DUF1877)